jgi:hypothetical protein
MKIFFLFFLLLPVCYASFSQYYILDKRSKIKKNLEQYYAEHNRKYSFAENDSTVTYILNDSLSLPATSVFYFNNRNACIKQEVIFSCDSCLQKSIQESLTNKFTKWKKIGADSYYTGFPFNVLMEPVKENGQFMMRYTHLRRKALKDHKEE